MADFDFVLTATNKVADALIQALCYEVLDAFYTNFGKMETPTNLGKD